MEPLLDKSHKGDYAASLLSKCPWSVYKVTIYILCFEGTIEAIAVLSYLILSGHKIFSVNMTGGLSFLYIFICITQSVVMFFGAKSIRTVNEYEVERFSTFLKVFLELLIFLTVLYIIAYSCMLNFTDDDYVPEEIYAIIGVLNCIVYGAFYCASLRFR